jgi:hypothetical protein
MSFQIEIDKEIKNQNLYFVGSALPPDWYAAFIVWLPMAQAGDAKAQFNVGRCYQRGYGIEQNSGNAISWLMKAADQGDPRALREIETINRELRFKQIDGKRRQHQTDVMKAFNQVQELLKLERNEEAKKSIQDNTDVRMAWIKNYLPCFDVAIDFHISTDIDSDYEKTGGYKSFTTGNLTTTHADIKKTDWIVYTAVIRIKNNSNQKLVILFDDGRMMRVDKLSTATYTKKNDSFNPHTIKEYYFLTAGKLRSENDASAGRIFSSGEVLIDNEKFELGSYDAQLRFKVKDAITIPGKQEKSGCFVLTACYGDENHPTVTTFRNFRDDYLLKNNLSKRTVVFYYKHGPRAAQVIQSRPGVMLFLRVLFRVVAIVLPKKI